MSRRKSEIARLESELYGINGELELLSVDLAHSIAIDLIASLAENDATRLASNRKQEYRRLSERKQEIEKRLYTLSACQSLIDLYGEDLHDAYKDKYPINRDTKVEKIYQEVPMDRRYHYVLPSPIEPAMWQDNEPPMISPVMQSIQWGTTQLEMWARTGVISRTILGYAPELNVVFDFTDAYHDSRLRKAPWNFD